MAAVWGKYLGAAFLPFQAAFLEPKAPQIHTTPCPRRCGCDHDVVRRLDGSFVGLCRCDPPRCSPLLLPIDQVVPFKLSWPKLGRALCTALSLEAKPNLIELYNTQQFGSWSADAIPAILTIQLEDEEFLFIVGQLAARLRQKFILLAPTSAALDATAKELLANCSALFLPLETTVLLTRQGTLQPLKRPAELFAPLLPNPQSLAVPGNPATEVTDGTHGTRAAGVPPSASRFNAPHAPHAPPYSLRKGLGVWHLTFNGRPADLRHERGIAYVAWLLYHPPPQPIHALDLMGKIPELCRQQFALAELLDPNTGRTAPLETRARLQERSLALEDAQTMRALFRKEKELEAILDDDSESEPVKAEALRELEAIAAFQRQHGRRSRDSAQRAARTVRQSIERFCRHLLAARDAAGSPHPVLHPFAEHLKRHLLIPSARYCGPTGQRARGPLAGSFTYEPPPGVLWAD